MPTSVANALTKANSINSWVIGMCDSFVAHVYGYANSGYGTAVTNWNSTPSNLKHPNDMRAPAGALMFWGGGDGHVAISLGNGSIRSTDIGGPGTVTTVPATAISKKWGKPYLGWSYPYFKGQKATTGLGTATGATTVADQTAFNATDVSQGFLNAIVAPFQNLMNMFIWGFETMVGMALMVVGIFIIVRTRVQ